MKRLKIGLNGFGRIGRAFTRIAVKRNHFDVVAINTKKTRPDMLAYLLRHDSIYRRFDRPVEAREKSIIVDGKEIIAFNYSTPEDIAWDDYGIDAVIDATGAFTTKEDLEKHLKKNVKKVILTAPAKDEKTPHVVLGVNENQINWSKETVISMASCTTNCASPLFKVLDDNFKIISGFLTTVHALTMTQSMLDDSQKSFDRSRAAILNITPSTSGAAKAVVKTLPQLKGKIEVGAIRVPVATGSLSDVAVLVEKQTNVEEVNTVFKQASQSEMKQILEYETEVLVSADFIGSPYSCIFDSNYTKVINGNHIKVVGWYDNEWGYSTRLVDLVEKLADFI